MTKQQRRAVRVLCSAFDHLRPRMTGDTLMRIPRNDDADAGSVLTAAMLNVLEEAK